MKQPAVLHMTRSSCHCEMIWRPLGRIASEHPSNSNAGFMLQRLNPDVRGLHFIEVESCHRLRGRYFTAFVHILFFLLDNAVRHSRVATGSYSCCVTIRSKSNELLICVENRVSTPAVAKTAAKAINDRIAELKKVLDPMKVVKEGGSGFGKIMAALRYEFKQ